MEATACIKGRRSIRDYTGRDIARETLEEIVETASYAPFWKNSQTVSYIAVKNPEIKKRIAGEGVMGFIPNQHRVLECNTLVVLLTENGISGYNDDGSATTSKGPHWQSFDAGIAAQTLCLAAHTLNVGSVILGIYDEEAVAGILNGDLGRYGISALIAMGYTEAHPRAPGRKSVPELLTVLD